MILTTAGLLRYWPSLKKRSDLKLNERGLGEIVRKGFDLM